MKKAISLFKDAMTILLFTILIGLWWLLSHAKDLTKDTHAESECRNYCKVLEKEVQSVDNKRGACICSPN